MKKDCEKDHRHWQTFSALPHDQGGIGRHKCAGCAYEMGFQDGMKRNEMPKLDFETLKESQAGAVRHRSPHAAWAQGYLDGVRKSYEE